MREYLLADTADSGGATVRASPSPERHRDGNERVTVTKNGTPVAVILAVEDFDSLLETLEVLSDRSAVADIREAEQQMAQGQVFSEEQVRTAVTNRRRP